VSSGEHSCIDRLDCKAPLNYDESVAAVTVLGSTCKDERAPDARNIRRQRFCSLSRGPIVERLGG